MENLTRFCKSIVASLCLSAAVTAAPAQEATEIDQLLSELADPETENWQQVERRIRTEWSKSGSPAMDLLLQRGREAMEEEDWEAAYEHFSALTDHAPDFAEGWHARATVLFRQERYGPALDAIGRTLALNPNHFNALSGLAVILEQIGMEEEALEAWRMVSRLHPHNEATQEALDRLERMHGGQSL